jgi:hypothetical protein
MQNEHQRLRNEYKARRFNTFQERTNHALFEGAVAAAHKAADVAVRKAMAADAGCGDYDPRYGYDAEFSVAWNAGFEEAYCALMDKAEAAVEAAVAKALGHESWDAFLEAGDDKE